MKHYPWKKILLKSLSYVLVAALASTCTLALTNFRSSKLTELERIIEQRFIGSYDMGAMEDAAAEAMVDALSDRWSFYLSAEEYADYAERVQNAYVGIGVTVTKREDNTGLDVLEVHPGGSAVEGGVLPGDIIVNVDGQSVAGDAADDIRSRITGPVGTQVSVTVLRGSESLTFTLERRKIKVIVATGQMLDGNIGLVRINNFNKGCGEETIKAIEDLRAQGATALIFDVRNNPGGYVSELVQVLDHLLPEGIVFREVDYLGREGTRRSNAACVEMPMAVLVNGDSYSAAEFFAACLREYDWATVVGEKTCGKGYYQTTITLSDGSAVNLSVGKYFTPDGVNLTEAGGLTPDVPVEVDEKTAALIYAQTISPGDDTQLQAAVAALVKTQG